MKSTAAPPGSTRLAPTTVNQTVGRSQQKEKMGTQASVTGRSGAPSAPASPAPGSALTRRYLLEKSGCEVVEAADTGRFAPYVDLYLQMVDMQLTYDALRVLGYDGDAVAAVAGEMAFLQKLAHEGKLAQGRFVARKR